MFYPLQVKVLKELSDRNEYQFESQITGFGCREALPNQSTFKLTNLEPDTHYQVDIRANNVNGDSPSSFYIFKTKGGKWLPVSEFSFYIFSNIRNLIAIIITFVTLLVQREMLSEDDLASLLMSPEGENVF